MDDAISLAQKIGAIGFGGGLALILVGSYFKIWLWYSTHLEITTALIQQATARHAELEKRIVDMQTDFERRLAKEEAMSNDWRDMTLKAAGLAEGTVFLAKKSNAR